MTNKELLELEEFIANLPEDRKRFLQTLSKRERKQLAQNYKWWAERAAEEQSALTERGIKATERQLKNYFQDTMFNVMQDFESVYLKVIANVAEGVTPTPADLYKLDSYWQMQAKLAKELEKLGSKQAQLYSKNFTDHYIKAYSLALPSGSAFSEISREAAEQMVNSIWVTDGKTWSDRVWNNTAKLKAELNKGLMDCVITGKPTSVLKNDLKERFGVAYNRADSIVRTEYSHIQNEAARKRYKDSGVKQVEVWADPDERTCDICGKMHEKKFNVNGVVPVPAHPRCRCRIIPVIETEQLTFDI
jgi:SPP1 gp7 family putative phage head morphogenesis protein